MVFSSGDCYNLAFWLRDITSCLLLVNVIVIYFKELLYLIFLIGCSYSSCSFFFFFGDENHFFNQGSISVSMSVFQTLVCFICTHLTSGEKEAEAVKRNADVHEIHRRTHFNSFSTIRLPKSIYDHEWVNGVHYNFLLYLLFWFCLLTALLLLLFLYLW